MELTTVLSVDAGPSTNPVHPSGPDRAAITLHTDKEGLTIITADTSGVEVKLSTMPPEHLNTVAVVGAALEFGRGTDVHATLELAPVKAAMLLDSVDNTRDKDKPVSAPQAAALAEKLNTADLPAHQPMSFVDGLTAALGDKLDKTTYNAGQATQALGIKYEWGNLAAQTAQTGMVAGEQGVLVGSTAAERDVYKFDGTTWAYSYKLSASHNHDDLYYSKSLIDAKLADKLSAADLPTAKPIGFISGLQDALDAKAPAASVKTPVPENVVFTTLSQAQQDARTKTLTDNWAEAAGSGLPGKSLRQSLSEISASASESSNQIKKMQMVSTAGYIHAAGQRQNLDGLMQIIWDSEMDSFCLTTPALKTASGAVPKLDIFIQTLIAYTNPTVAPTRTATSEHWCETHGNSITGAHGFSIVKPAFTSNYMENSDTLDQFCITLSVQSRGSDDVQMIYKLEGCTFINKAAGSKKHAHYTCTSFGVNNLIPA